MSFVFWNTPHLLFSDRFFPEFTIRIKTRECNINEIQDQAVCLKAQGIHLLSLNSMIEGISNTLDNSNWFWNQICLKLRFDHLFER